MKRFFGTTKSRKDTRSHLDARQESTACRDILFDKGFLRKLDAVLDDFGIHEITHGASSNQSLDPIRDSVAERLGTLGKIVQGSCTSRRGVCWVGNGPQNLKDSLVASAVKGFENVRR